MHDLAGPLSCLLLNAILAEMRLRRTIVKYLKSGPYEAGALTLIVLAVVVRGVLIGLGWPLLDSDEGTMGLMAMHIAFRGEHPLFFYGQGYMGSLEAYLAAVMFHFFGVSTFTLRSGLLLLFSIFLAGIYLLSSLVYTKRFALLTLLVLCLASNQQLIRELVAVGGDPETLVTGTLVFLLAIWLILTFDQDRTKNWRRWLLYGAWGFVAGAGLWCHLLVAPFIAFSGLLLLLFCWRELWGRASVCIVAGLLVGASPLIYYNLTAPGGRTTLFYALNAISAGGATRHPSSLEQVKGALLVSLPTITGANPLCPVADVHFLRLNSWYGLRCTLVHTGWSLGILLLWSVATCSALWGIWRYRASFYSSVPAERRNAVLYVARLALLLNGAVPLVLYIFSPNSALYPVATSRYLIGLLVSTPALLWPLWRAAQVMRLVAGHMFPSSTNISVRIGNLVGGGSLLLIVVILAGGLLSTFTGIPSVSLDPQQDVYYTQINTQQHLDVPVVRSLNRQEALLIAGLLRMGATHIYSDYWTCDRLIFQSQERIICSALQGRLEPAYNRYQPYHTLVAADAHAAYVFHVASLLDVTFAQHMASSNTGGRKYQRVVLAGYAIYQLKE